MKRNAILAASCLLVMMASCSSDDPVMQQSVGYNTVNLVMPLQEDAEAFVQNGSYTFVTESYSQTLNVATQGVTVNNRNYPFTSQSLSYSGMLPNISFNAPYIYTDNIRFQGLNGLVTTAVYTPAYLNINNSVLSGVAGISDFGVACLIQYEIPDVAMVKTIQREAYYAGNTDTTVSGGDPFSSKSAVFRVILDIEKQKATVVVYNAKFNSQMPSLTFILRNLDIEYTHEGYNIKGENIIPEEVTGTPYPNFPFTKFDFKATGKALSDTEIDFTVAGRFHGHFTGTFLIQQ